ncbi:MAG: elongation factor P [Planctomycetes bacterium]|nr:elongation factor P [Planctomycetota bacterium]
MGSMGVGEVSKGTKLIFENAPWLVVEVNFVKPGKGTAFYKLRVQNLLSGNTLEKTLRSGEKVETADVNDVDMQYLYSDANGYVFMDKQNFEQITVTQKAVGKDKDFLLENMDVMVTLWNGEPIALQLPNSVIMEVVYTEPAVKGDTQSRVMKPAKLQTGAEIPVPIFVATGDKITVNTQTREYLGRVK